MELKNTVSHIADLAKLELQEHEYDVYQVQISDILTEIEKIINVEINENDVMISSCTNSNCFNNDEIGVHVNKELGFKNAMRIEGDYLISPKVIE